MEQRIIFKEFDGSLAVICPAPECLESHTIEEIAAKDVPFGTPYRIVPVTEVPTDRTFRNAWTIDDALLIDGVGAESDEFLQE